jgi:hypothetical protein
MRAEGGDARVLIVEDEEQVRVLGSAFLQKPYTVEQLQHALAVYFGIMPRAS